MRFSQAAVVAILAFTVTAKPLQARQDVQTNDYKTTPDPYPVKCYDKHTKKEKPCGGRKLCHIISGWSTNLTNSSTEPDKDKDKDYDSDDDDGMLKYLTCYICIS